MEHNRRVHDECTRAAFGLAAPILAIASVLITSAAHYEQHHPQGTPKSELIAVSGSVSFAAIAFTALFIGVAITPITTGSSLWACERWEDQVRLLEEQSATARWKALSIRVASYAFVVAALTTLVFALDANGVVFN